MIPFYQNEFYNDSSKIEELEQRFSDYVGAKYGIAVSSCTSALAICYRYHKEKRIFYVPDMTYVSVANEVIHSGHELQLVDSWHAGHEYHVGGNIADSAHEVNFKTDWESGIKRCYSFYPTKLVPSYEGGMICTNDSEFAEWARTFRQMGRTGYGAKYDVKTIGLKCNMTPLQAAYALESLNKLEQTKKRHQEIQYTYRMHGLIPLVDSDHLMIIRVEQNNISLYDSLRLEGIETSIHFRPITEKSAYKGITGPYCDDLKDHILSLPMYPTMSDEEVLQVCKIVGNKIREM